MVTEVHPLPTRSAERECRALQARAELLAREPWRDPASEHYDPLRILRSTLQAEPARCSAR